MKQHKNAELINTWLDNQDVVGFQGEVDGEWKPVSLNCVIYEPDRYAYRIDPDCRYAKERIRELGGDEVVEVYQYWLGGGEIEQSESGDYSGYIQVNDKNREDPFGNFICALAGLKLKFRKKKKTVKQVLWVSSNVTDCVYAYWHREGFNPNGSNKPFEWHKVPTCTREVEV